ncbi:MAG: hypothetical protein HKN17_07520, partial [Rhodothermales bacterium]|nr:hypothetical protein [Rhodothermales bacterium]
VKAVRLLCDREALYQERIRFCIGLICGHLKSTAYAEMIAWQLGVEPGDLASINFRHKIPGATAKQKGVEVRAKRDGSRVRSPELAENLFGTDYNLGLFQYKACDYCDDVVGETADISVGDAWLPEYIPDGQGTSLLITRNRQFQQLIDNAVSEGRVTVEPLSVDQVVASQRGGFRQRREGLAYRLSEARREGRWTPEKRVKASRWRLSRRRREIYSMRVRLWETSHELFREAVHRNDFAYFRSEMGEMIQDYAALYKLPWLRRIRRGLMRRVKRVKMILGRGIGQ